MLFCLSSVPKSTVLLSNSEESPDSGHLPDIIFLPFVKEYFTSFRKTIGGTPSVLNLIRHPGSPSLFVQENRERIRKTIFFINNKEKITKIRNEEKR